ncbi:MAG: hypothetical protein HC917_18500 [Richelia sp. SM2_1_7]|nr:hypothetical protein [Richelia sp. SM2_1_7]
MKSPLTEARAMGKQSPSACWENELFVFKDGGSAKPPTKINIVPLLLFKENNQNTGSSVLTIILGESWERL